MADTSQSAPTRASLNQMLAYILRGPSAFGMHQAGPQNKYPQTEGPPPVPGVPGGVIVGHTPFGEPIGGSGPASGSEASSVPMIAHIPSSLRTATHGYPLTRADDDPLMAKLYAYLTGQQVNVNKQQRPPQAPEYLPNPVYLAHPHGIPNPIENPFQNADGTMKPR